MLTESLALQWRGEGSQQRAWANIGLKEMVRAKSFSERSQMPEKASASKNAVRSSSGREPDCRDHRPIALEGRSDSRRR
jgi:hypothetical protein